MELARRPPAKLFSLVEDQWTRPFWAAAREGRLVAPRCSDCGRFRMPPTPFCPHCRSQRLDWPTLPGGGTVFSYTVVARAVVPEMAGSLPYVPALVDLDEAPGARLITAIVDVPVEAIRIGARVRVVFDAEGDGVGIPRFTLD